MLSINRFKHIKSVTRPQIEIQIFQVFSFPPPNLSIDLQTCLSSYY